MEERARCGMGEEWKVEKKIGRNIVHSKYNSGDLLPQLNKCMVAR